MTLQDQKNLIDYCVTKNIKLIKYGDLEVEFFPPKPEQMDLDPVALSKILSDSMPPDSAMLYASTEDLDIKENE